jgi:hypothetical protein
MTLLPHLSKEYAPAENEEGGDESDEGDEGDDDDGEDEEEGSGEGRGQWAAIEGEGGAQVGEYDASAGDY